MHVCRSIAAIRDAVADAQTAGHFRREVSPTFAAKMLYGALDEMATNWILSRRRYALAAQADEVVDLLLDEDRDRLLVLSGAGSEEVLVTDLTGASTGTIELRDAVSAITDEARGW